MNYDNIDFSTLDILVCVDYYGLSCKKSTENRYILPCCFHNERTPSLNLYLQNNKFHCFGCGAKGNIANFVMQMENIDFVPALQVIRKIYGLDTTNSTQTSKPPQRIIQEIAPTQPKTVNTDNHIVYNDLLAFCATMPNKTAIDYLTEERCLGAELLRKANIQTFEGVKLEKYLRAKYTTTELQKFGLVSEKNYFYFKKYQIVIPYYHHSKIATLQFRTGLPPALQPNEYCPKYKYLKGIAVIPYNTDNLIFLGKDDKVAITEGVIDCLTIYGMNEFLPAEQRFVGAIALPSATVINKELFTALQSQNLQITCFIDKDKAGSKAKEKIRMIAQELNYKIDFRVLNAYKDVNELFVNLIRQGQ